MQTLDVLNKIKGLNGDIIGCVVRHGDEIVGNMPAEYGERDFELITDDLAAMFTVLDSFDPAPDVQHFMLDFAAHKVYVRKMEEGFLAVFNLNLERVSFRKLQVATNLHAAALEASLKAPAPAAVEASAGTAKKGAGLMGFLRQAEAAAEPARPAPDEPRLSGKVSQEVAAPSGPDTDQPKKKRMYRGVAY